MDLQDILKEKILNAAEIENDSLRLSKGNDG